MIFEFEHPILRLASNNETMKLVDIGLWKKDKKITPAKIEGDPDNGDIVVCITGYGDTDPDYEAYLYSKNRWIDLEQLLNRAFPCYEFSSNEYGIFLCTFEGRVLDVKQVQKEIIKNLGGG